MMWQLRALAKEDLGYEGWRNKIKGDL